MIFTLHFLNLGISIAQSISKHIFSAKKCRAFYESQLGDTLNVLWEGENKKGFITGFTQNYVKVKTFWNPELVNTIQEVTLKDIDEDGAVRIEEEVLSA